MKELENVRIDTDRATERERRENPECVEERNKEIHERIRRVKIYNIFHSKINKKKFYILVFTSFSLATFTLYMFHSIYAKRLFYLFLS